MSSDLKLAKSFYFTAIDGVASFPEVMTAIREAISDPGATPATVGRAVERDVAFASRLLRIVNAPTSGLLRPCASLPHAIALVGLARIGMHAEKVASLAALSQCAAVAPEITKRSAIEAAIARVLAATVGASAEHAFTAALLANVGSVAILATQPGWTAEHESGCIEEHERLGFDHAELGADILRRWHLPAPIPDVVFHHHDLDDANAFHREVGRLVALLQAAAHLAPHVQAEGEPNVDEWSKIADHPALAQLEIDAVKLAKLWPELVGGINEEEAGAPVPERSAWVTAPPPRPKSRKGFYFAMAAAVVIPAVVGFELFFR
jgi:HD-like signal output (HDOD) protein